MSFILMLFYWVVIPVAVFLIALRLWKNSKSTLSKGFVVGVTTIVFVGLWWWAIGEKWMLDRQVRELCAKDGGVKVYETVKLSPGLMKKYTENITVIPYRKLKNTDEYYMDWEITYLKKGNPSLQRSHFRLIRSIDQKLLGESVMYSRGGGDLPGPWHGSSFKCPEPTQHLSLEFSVFLKGDKK